MVYKLLRLERRQAVIVPVQDTVLAAKASPYLMPMVAVLGDGTLLGFEKIGDRSGIVLPVGT